MRSERRPRVVRANEEPAPADDAPPILGDDEGGESIGVSREEIGRRLRTVRLERGWTLRQLAAAASLSATHISEIERGRTMPTIGALARLSAVLGRAPSAFLESRWLPEVSLMRAGDPKPRIPAGALGGGAEVMTHGIPGGALVCARLVTGDERPMLTCGGELGGYVVRGTARIRAGGEEFLAETGDGFHLRADTPATISSASSEPAEVLILLSQPGSD